MSNSPLDINELLKDYPELLEYFSDTPAEPGADVSGFQDTPAEPLDGGPEEDAFSLDMFDTLFIEKDEPSADKQVAVITPPSQFRRVMRHASTIVLYVCVIVYILGSVVFVFSQDFVASFFGFGFYDSKHDSVSLSQADNEPELGGFKKGDLLFVRKTSPDKIKTDDIVTVRTGASNSAMYQKYRVLEVGDDFRLTLSDGSDTRYVYSEELLGKTIFVIPKLGGVVQYLRGHIISSLIFTFLAFGVIIISWYYFTKPEEKQAS